jgi:GNAT superfamily N-acetyltransferase
VAVRELPRPPSHPDPAALARRLERAEAEQLARAGSPGRAGALEVAGGIAVSKGPRSPLSAAFGLALAGPVSSAELGRVEAHLGALGGDVRVELCAHADPSLAAELARRGYRVERFLLALARPLAGAAAPRAAGLVVREIGPDEARAWADAIAVAHLGSAPESDEAAEDLLALARMDGAACFAAFAGGTPVAVGLVSAHEGVATLAGAGVLPGWRGRGLQGALVAARLAWAGARGCDVAAAATEPGGPSQRTLERAGFRVAYPKVVMVRAGWARADATSWSI